MAAPVPGSGAGRSGGWSRSSAASPSASRRWSCASTSASRRPTARSSPTIARAAVGDGFAFAAFQLLSALLLLAAAASSYLAGAGVLKALSRPRSAGAIALLPAPLSRENRFLVSHWGVAVVLATAVAMIAAAGGQEQVLVRFYAVSVFASFLAATLACARLSRRDGDNRMLAANLLGAALVALVLALNLTRLDSAIALLASAAVALYLWRTWVGRGRPGGVSRAGAG